MDYDSDEDEDEGEDDEDEDDVCEDEDAVEDEKNKIEVEDGPLSSPSIGSTVDDTKPMEVQHPADKEALAASMKNASVNSDDVTSAHIDASVDRNNSWSIPQKGSQNTARMGLDTIDKQYKYKQK